MLNPDGEYINIDWKLFQPGMSVFIPAINLKRLERQMRAVASLKRFTIKSAERIEGGLLGMRFWRIS